MSVSVALPTTAVSTERTQHNTLNDWTQSGVNIFHQFTKNSCTGCQFDSQSVSDRGCFTVKVNARPYTGRIEVRRSRVRQRRKHIDIHLVSEYGRCPLRSSTDRTLTVPRTNNRFGDRSFAVAGPRLWNSLPISLRQISSYGQFRRYLKNHLNGI